MVVDLGFSINVKQRVRLLGLDTPELNSFDKSVRDRALAAKKFTSDWIEAAGSGITVKTYKDDKYGRILAELRSGGVTLNDLLLENGHAVRYNGGSRS